MEVIGNNKMKKQLNRFALSSAFHSTLTEQASLKASTTQKLTKVIFSLKSSPPLTTFNSNKLLNKAIALDCYIKSSSMRKKTQYLKHIKHIKRTEKITKKALDI